jgi:rhomboid protease GluP
VNRTQTSSKPTTTKGQLPKVKLIFLPFLILSVGFLIGYSLLRYLVDVQLHLPVKDYMLNLAVPLILPCLLSAIFLRKRVRLLDLKGERQDGYFPYVLFAGIFAAIPTLVAQFYIEKAAYNLNELENPAAIAAAPPDKYYHFAQYSVDSVWPQGGFASHLDYNWGKHDITFRNYCVIPFDQTRSDAKATSRVWYVKEYKKTVSEVEFDEDRNGALNEFLKQSNAEFRHHDFTQATYFEDLPSSTERDGFTEAIHGFFSDLPADAHLYLLSPHDEQFSERTGNLLPWVFWSLLLTSVAFLLMVIIPNRDPRAWNAFLKKKSNPDGDELMEFLLYFIPRGDHFMTTILVDLNLLLFLGMVISGVNLAYPKAPDLINWGASSTEMVMEIGEYWRVFTAMFVHAGLQHIAMNMVALAVCGFLLEPILGKWKFLLVYLIAGLGGSISSLIFNENVVSCGASGAIFGLYGIMLVLLLCRIIPRADSQIYWIILGAYGALNLVLGFFIKEVDNACHLGGLATGIALGLLLALLFRKGLKAKAENA